MSPAPLNLVLLGRALANLLVNSIQVLPLLGVLLLFNIRLPLRWEGLPVFVLILVGVYGFGTILAVSAMPAWLVFIAMTLPSTRGIIVLRQVVLEGTSLTSTWADGSLVWLIIHSTLYFVVGWLVLGVCYRVTRERGSLGQY